MSRILIQPAVDLFPFILHPSQSTRIPLTLQRTLLYAVLPHSLYLLQCALAQQPNTWSIRRAIACILTPWLWLTAFAVHWIPYEPFFFLSIISSMSHIVLGLRTIDFAWQERPITRLSRQRQSSPFSDAVDLACNFRGIGYSFGLGLKLPPSYPRSSWLRHVFFHGILGNFLLLDVTINILIKWYSPTLQSVASGLHIRDLPWKDRLVVTMSFPIFVITGISAGYWMVAYLAVLLQITDREQWPPIFGSPFTSTSLHELWAVQWHQLLRRTFLITGGYPLEALIGRPGLVLGVFASSGLIHSLMLTGHPKASFDWSTFNFFAIQAFGLFVETAFRKATGRKVGGIAGWLWTLCWLTETATNACTTWTRLFLQDLERVPRVLGPTVYLFNLVG